MVIACGAEIVARHSRSYEKADVIFDPLHYQAVILSEEKVGALDQAAPLKGWDLPEDLPPYTDGLERRMSEKGQAGICQWQVLRLLDQFEKSDLHAAIKQALNMGAIGYDAGASACAGPSRNARPGWIWITIRV